MSTELSPTVIQAPPEPPSEAQAIGLSLARVVEATLRPGSAHASSEKSAFALHSVARQLRLRKDYRPTLEVDDDYDLQDLLCALLKVEFEEVTTDEWTPPYTQGGASNDAFCE